MSGKCWHGGPSVRDGDLLEQIPAVSDTEGAARGHARPRRRPRGPQGGCGKGGRNLASLKIHFPRNTLAQAGKDQRQRVRAAIPTAFAQDAFEAASTAWRVLAQQLRRKVQKRAERMDDAQADVLAYRNVPRAHRTQSDTTNLLEPRNVAVQRRPVWPVSSQAGPPSSAPSTFYGSSKTTSGPCSDATRTLKDCYSCATIRSLGCPQWSTERVTT